jgi:hypothetical protein
MLKTFIIDGDKGGVGKSLAARALVHHYLTLPNELRPKIIVYDADLSNPDVCGAGGLEAGSGIIATALIDLSTENGWIDLGTRVAAIATAAEKSDYRIIINMPAQIGTRAFDGSIHIVSEVLREANAIPIWMLSRTQESLHALNYRLRNMPERYATGVVIKNLFFGSADKFVLWEGNELRLQLIDVSDGNGWIESELPELNDQLTVMIGRNPFHEVLQFGIEGKLLPFGYRLALESWLKRSSTAMSIVESIARG